VLPQTQTKKTILIPLNIAMMERQVRQTRMAVELGMDPAKLSRIVNGITPPKPDDQLKIAEYLGMRPAELFA
jgi:transcriptional regulator with XRE-family HTH domain